MVLWWRVYDRFVSLCCAFRRVALHANPLTGRTSLLNKELLGHYIFISHRQCGNPSWGAVYELRKFHRPWGKFVPKNIIIQSDLQDVYNFTFLSAGFTSDDSIIHGWKLLGIFIIIKKFNLKQSFNTHVLLPCIQEEITFPYQWDKYSLFLDEALHLSWILGTAGCRISSDFFRDDPNFIFVVISAGNTVSHTCRVWNDRNMFTDISGADGNGMVIHSQNSSMFFFNGTQVKTQITTLPFKHLNTIQSREMLLQCLHCKHWL